MPLGGAAILATVSLAVDSLCTRRLCLSVALSPSFGFKPGILGEGGNKLELEWLVVDRRHVSRFVKPLT